MATDTATATPASVGVTAGAANQAPFTENGQTTLNFTEQNTSAFPTTGENATVSLPADSGIRFDRENSSLQVSGSGVSGTASFVDDRTITISVDGVSDTENETLTLDGVRFVVQPDAGATDLSWAFGDATGTTAVEPERFKPVYEGEPVESGVDNEPENATTLQIRADHTRSNGLHAKDNRMVVRIPASHQDNLSFDQDNEPTVTFYTGGCSKPLDWDLQKQYSEHELSFPVNCEVDSGAILIDGLYYDTPGATIGDVPDPNVTLEVQSIPVDAVGNVTSDATEPVNVVAPEVGVVDGNVTTVGLGASQDAGDEPVRITVTDEHGGLLAGGSTATVELREQAGVSFDTSQDLEVVAGPTDHEMDVTVANVSGQTVTLDVNSNSSAGESIRLQRAGGDGIRFNVSDSATEQTVPIDVTTNAGGDPVTQASGGAVTVDSGSSPSVSLTADGPTAIERGAESAQGNQSIGVEIADDAGGAVAAGSTIEVALPGGSGVAYDTGQDLEVVTGSTGTAFDATVSNVSAETVTISVNETSRAGESIRLRSGGDGLLFNVSGNPSVEQVRFNVTTENEYGVGTTNTTAPAVTVVEPTAEAALQHGGPTYIAAGENQSAGNESIVVNVSDDVGGAVDEGTTIEVAVDSQVGVAFDESQSLTVEQPETGQSFDATVTEVTADRVRLEVTGENGAGESIRLVNSDGEGIRFNVSDDADGESVALDVTTNNGERNTTSTTGPAVQVLVSSGSDGGSGSGGGGGSDSGGGGGGGGGGAASEPSADVNVTDVSLSTVEIRQGGTVDVTVTLVNEGGADGSYELQVRANILRVATETVEVAEGERKNVTVPVRFAHAGDRKITVDGVEGGTVTVAELEPQNLPNGTVAADAQPVMDMDAERNGTVVEFDENVTVDAIVFGNASDGTATVADLEALPGDSTATPGSLVVAMDVQVPTDLADEPATIRLSIDADEVEDANSTRLGRYHDGEWQTLEPTLVEASGGEVVYEFETPGFSTFAMFAQETEDSQVTDTPGGADDPTATQTATVTDGATDTEDRDDETEEASFGMFGLVVLGVVALIAVFLAAAGIRLYRQNKR